MKTHFKSGDWNAVCDICGFRFKASQLKRNWKNEYVCENDFELRNAQDFIRVPTEKVSVPWVRPESDIPLAACYVWGQSAFAGLGTAGCMRAGYQPMTSTLVWALKYNYGEPYNTASAIPGYAIPGQAIPATVPMTSYGYNP